MLNMLWSNLFYGPVMEGGYLGVGTAFKHSANIAQLELGFESFEPEPP